MESMILSVARTSVTELKYPLNNMKRNTVSGFILGLPIPRDIVISFLTLSSPLILPMNLRIPAVPAQRGTVWRDRQTLSARRFVFFIMA